MTGVGSMHHSNRGVPFPGRRFLARDHEMGKLASVV
jgi:hypothetical protein